MKKKKDSEDPSLLAINNVKECETKLETEMDYFANDPVNFKDKANMKDRPVYKTEDGEKVVGPDGPAEPVVAEC